MSSPNPRYAGVDILVTRRVHNSEFRLRPCPKVNNIVSYVVATVANHYELELHALVVMSDHYHVRFHDPHGRADDYARDAHAMIAKLVISTFNEDDESLWAPVPTNILEDELDGGAIDHIAYCATNPCAAGLVRRGSSWPGVNRHWPAPPKVIKQPPKFFQEDSWHPEALTAAGRPKIHWAKSVVLKFVRPRGYEELTDAELVIRVRDAIAAREARSLEKWRDRDEAYPGKRALRGVNRRRRARPSQPKRKARRTPNVRVAPGERRRQRLSGIRAWRRDYRTCMKRWPTNRNVVFPFGTNKMRDVHNVIVDGRDSREVGTTPT